MRHRASSTVCALAAAVCLGAAAPDRQTISDPSIKIADIRGSTQSPFHLAASELAALFFVMHDCPISNFYAGEIKRVCSQYGSKGLHCYLVYVEPGLSKEQAARHFADYGHGDYPGIIDSGHVMVQATGAVSTPEAAVVDSSGRIRYRGRIDNFYAGWGKARRQATEHELRDALNSLFAGREVRVPRTNVVGCFIPTVDLSNSTP